MSEYIEREAAIAYIKENQCKRCSDIGLCGKCAVLTAVKLFESIPAADVRPVVRARWSEYEDELFGETIKSYCCSNCHHLISRTTIIRNYCPRCGAWMEES